MNVEDFLLIEVNITKKVILLFAYITKKLYLCIVLRTKEVFYLFINFFYI